MVKRKDKLLSKRMKKVREKSTSVIHIKKEHIRGFNSAEDIDAADARFYCRVKDVWTIRSHCAIGYCKEIGCPFFQDEKEQDLLIRYREEHSDNKNGMDTVYVIEEKEVKGKTIKSVVIVSPDLKRASIKLKQRQKKQRRKKRLEEKQVQMPEPDPDEE